MSDIPYSEALRTNLLALQRTQRLFDQTQDKLSTGKRVAKPVDDPANYFAALNLRERADDLQGRLDGMGQAVQTIEAAQSGVDGMRGTLSSMKALVDNALSNTNAESRREFGRSFNELLVQLNNFAKDSEYAGFNLLQGNERLTVQFREIFDDSVLEISGFNAVGPLEKDNNGEVPPSLVRGAELVPGTPAQGSIASQPSIGSQASFASQASQESRAAIAAIPASPSQASVAFQPSQASQPKISSVASQVSIASDGSRAAIGAQSAVPSQSAFSGAPAIPARASGSGVEYSAVPSWASQKSVSSQPSRAARGTISSQASVASQKAIASFSGIASRASTAVGVSLNSSASIAAQSSVPSQVSLKSSPSLKSRGSQAAIPFQASQKSEGSQGSQASQASRARIVGRPGVPSQASQESRSSQASIASQAVIASQASREAEAARLEERRFAFTLDTEPAAQGTTRVVGIKSHGFRQTGDDDHEIDWGSSDYKTTLQTVLDEIESVDEVLKTQSKALAFNQSTIAVREDYTNEFLNTLEVGSDKLTLADLNEEASNLLALQTAQQLGVQSLSLANQQAQSVLRLLA